MDFLCKRLELVGECGLNLWNGSSDGELLGGFVGIGRDVKVWMPDFFPLAGFGIGTGTAVVIDAGDGVGAAVAGFDLGDLAEIRKLVGLLFDGIEFFLLLGRESGFGFIRAARCGV